MKNIYLKTILAQTPRLLSQLDRNSFSPTYGCFDRLFWHSHVTDFASARFQEACLTLTLLFGNSNQENPYYKNKKLKQWAIASLKYWQKIQLKDGSFNEWYPQEHSFVATAFTLYAVTETYLQLKLDDPSLIKSCIQAARWLITQTELLASNQQAGSIVALYNVYLLTRQKKYRQAAQNKLDQLIKTQTAEGWFPEYNGADIGYSSVLVDYLAKYYQKSGDSQTLTALKKLIDFLTYFIHPNQTFGGNYGSRNTDYLLPDGFAILSQLNFPAAQAISAAIISNLQTYPLNLDDRYLCYTGYTFIQANNDYRDQPIPDFIYTKKFIKEFKLAGIYLRSTNKYYAIINLKKGGVCKIYSRPKNTLIFESSGIIGRLLNQQIVSSQWLDQKTQIVVKNDEIFISGSLHLINFVQSSPLTIIGSRLLQTTFGRYQKFSLIIKKILRKKLILNTPLVPINYSKTFSFSSSAIKITNQIRLDTAVKFQSLAFNHKCSLIYVPSTRYFQLEELNLNHKTLSKSCLNSLNLTKNLSLTETIKI